MQCKELVNLDDNAPENYNYRAKKLERLHKISLLL